MSYDSVHENLLDEGGDDLARCGCRVGVVSDVRAYLFAFLCFFFAMASGPWIASDHMDWIGAVVPSESVGSPQTLACVV